MPNLAPGLTAQRHQANLLAHEGCRSGSQRPAAATASLDAPAAHPGLSSPGTIAETKPYDSFDAPQCGLGTCILLGRWPVHFVSPPACTSIAISSIAGEAAALLIGLWCLFFPFSNLLWFGRCLRLHDAALLVVARPGVMISTRTLQDHTAALHDLSSASSSAVHCITGEFVGIRTLLSPCRTTSCFSAPAQVDRSGAGPRQ